MCDGRFWAIIAHGPESARVTPFKMAEAINNYVEEYKEAITNTRNLLGKIDLTTPQANVIEADPATMTILKIQAETEAEAIGETLNFIKNNIPHLQQIFQATTLFQLQNRMPNSTLLVRRTSWLHTCSSRDSKKISGS